MTDTSLAHQNGAAIVSEVVLAGDLSKLSPQARVAYYQKTCESLGLNPLTQPFAYINLNGKLTLYCTRAATDQLRALRKVSLNIVAREKVEDLYVVTARATTPDGRTDESIGAVSVANLRGEALANAFMKAETKAKRRVTLAVVGLGWLDESEAGSIVGAERVDVDQHGQIAVARYEDRSFAERTGADAAVEAAARSTRPKADPPVDAGPPDELDETLAAHAPAEASDPERTDAAWLDYEAAYKAAVEIGMRVPRMRTTVGDKLLAETASSLRRAVNSKRPAR